MKSVRLEEIVTIADSGTWGEDAEPGSGDPVLRSTNIHGGKLDVADAAFRIIPAKDRDRRRLADGDIIVTASSGSPDLIGKCCLFIQPQDGQKYYFSNFTMRLRIDSSKADPRIIFYWLTSPQGRAAMDRMNNTTSGLRNLNKSLYLAQTIPLPPLAEQKRIAAVLDKADALRAKRRRAIETLDTLLQSVFIEMFGDPVTNPKGWRVLAFEDVAPSRLGKMLDAKQQTGRHARPYLRNISVQWDRFDLSDVQSMDFDDSDRAEFRLADGDLMICEGGEPGRCSIWRGELPECYFQKALHRARPWPDKATSEYLLYLMWLLADRGGFKDHVTAATIAHLTGEKLKVMRIPVPPIALQQQFTRVYANVRTRRDCFASAVAATNTLFASLQSAAFTGTLFTGQAPEIRTLAAWC